MHVVAGTVKPAVDNIMLNARSEQYCHKLRSALRDAAAAAVTAPACCAAFFCRCWLYLADALGKVLTPLPESFQTHMFWAFSSRAKQQDQMLCRLALFLDPLYRRAALSSSSSNMMAVFV